MSNTSFKRYQLLKNCKPVLQPQNDDITALTTKTPLKMNMKRARG
jgi:hypothetical protein